MSEQYCESRGNNEAVICLIGLHSFCPWADFENSSAEQRHPTHRSSTSDCETVGSIFLQSEKISGIVADAALLSIARIDRLCDCGMGLS